MLQLLHLSRDFFMAIEMQFNGVLLPEDFMKVDSLQEYLCQCLSHFCEQGEFIHHGADRDHRDCSTNKCVAVLFTDVPGSA